MTRAVWPASLALLLVGCATTPDSCQRLGLALSTGVALPAPDRASLAQLRCGVDLGQREAATELGRRYEHGFGVAQDQRVAARLYARAASASGGFTQIYAPPVRPGGRGQVMVLSDPGSFEPGDPEAQYRLALMRLEGRGIVQSPVRAERLLRAAARQGHSAAQRMLTILQGGEPGAVGPGMAQPPVGGEQRPPPGWTAGDESWRLPPVLRRERIAPPLRP